MAASTPENDSAAVHWEQLTNVERTCLGVAFARWHTSADGSLAMRWPDGNAWYTDPLGPLFLKAMPQETQEEMARHRLQGGGWLAHFVAVRTAELDHQMLTALEEGEGIRQIVLLGAGMDTRAWRLPLPAGTSVFEVDTQQVLAFKARVLGSGSGSGEQPQLSCDKRVPVVADASDPEELWTGLTSAGLDGGRPVLWLMEGFIGYLQREASDRLLKLLADRSAPGSRVLVTCPPGPDQKHRASAAVDALTKSGPGAAAEAAAVAAPDDGAYQANAAAAAVVSVASVTQEPVHLHGMVKLHHSTFEEPTSTQSRVCAAGWSVGCRLLTAEALASKYGVEAAQPIVVAAN